MKLILPISFAIVLLLPACGGKDSSGTSHEPIAPPAQTVSNGTNSESVVNEEDNEPMKQSSSHSASYGSGNVEYYNPRTGTQSTYTLDVDYDGNGDVERINFDHGGYIDESHIVSQQHNGDGTITVETDNGVEFTVEESGDYEEQ